MQFPDLGDGSAERGFHIEMYFECFLQEKQLGIEPKLFMLAVQSLEHIVRGVNAFYKFEVNDGDLFEDESTQGIIIQVPDCSSFRKK